MEDQKIIALFWDRSENAISETENKYGRYCHYIAHGILQSDEDAAECVNDTWLRAWNAIPPQRPSNLRTFLGKITRNLALNRYEQRYAQKRGAGQVSQVLEELQECIPSGNCTEQIIDQIVLRDVLNRFLENLKPDARKIFLRRYWYMSSIQEIARDFSMTESKVTVTLCRTRQKLAQILQKEGIGL